MHLVPDRTEADSGRFDSFIAASWNLFLHAWDWILLMPCQGAKFRQLCTSLEEPGDRLIAWAGCAWTLRTGLALQIG